MGRAIHSGESGVLAFTVALLPSSASHSQTQQLSPKESHLLRTLSSPSFCLPSPPSSTFSSAFTDADSGPAYHPVLPSLAYNFSFSLGSFMSHWTQLLKQRPWEHSTALHQGDAWVGWGVHSHCGGAHVIWFIYTTSLQPFENLPCFIHALTGVLVCLHSYLTQPPYTYERFALSHSLRDSVYYWLSLFWGLCKAEHGGKWWWVKASTL